MANRALPTVLVLVVCFGGLARCTPAEPRQTVAPAPRQTVKEVPKPPKAPGPPVVKSASKAASRPVAKTGCRELLDAYRRYVSRIPYPANMPYLPMLGIGEKVVKRWSRPKDAPVCLAQLRHIMSPLFGRSFGPGLGTPPTLPKADKK